MISARSHDHFVEFGVIALELGHCGLNLGRGLTLLLKGLDLGNKIPYITTTVACNIL
jgi:hypothetical protein